VKLSRAILLAEALLTFGIGPFVEEPLLQAACFIVGSVSAYSAFYFERGLGLYAGGYALILGAVALFTLSGHPIVRFAGWEGVSAVAWVLIAYGRGATHRSLEAAFIGLTINRLGDAFWVASLLSPGWNWGFILGGWVKAALFPLSFWLVQVMYAPIPVSALLHSALLVALGIYGPIQNPGWLEGLPLGNIRWAAEAAALASAIGALLSRVPKSALAWTTSAHLALSAAEWSNPPLAQHTLLVHAYLKAALFLLLGLAQKSLRWSPSLRAAWLIAIGFLTLSSTSATPLSLAAETITAFTLARFWRAYPYDVKAKSLGLLPFPLILMGLGIFQLGQKDFAWQWESLLPLVGISAGLITPWPKRRYRIDALILEFFAQLEQAWSLLARRAQKAEAGLLILYDKLFMSGLRGMRRLAWGESQLIEGVWRPALGRLRHLLALWVYPPPPWGRTYQGALQWAFLVTLLIFVIWRYFF
jgi:hypothetical protein